MDVEGRRGAQDRNVWYRKVGGDARVEVEGRVGGERGVGWWEGDGAG